jgi:uncharacterized membrane-anchored protein YjiN (DUF445 family)
MQGEKSMTQTNPRLWELSDIVSELETAIAAIQEDETLTDEERETKLEQVFNQWLETGESFTTKAEKVAAYIRHQEALSEARKAEAKRIRILAEQAENQAKRLRRYLTNQMVLTGQTRIDGVTVKIGLCQKPPRVMLKVPPEELPPEYVQVEYTPKLTKIKELLKVEAQEIINWACLSQSHEYSVIIR